MKTLLLLFAAVLGILAGGNVLAQSQLHPGRFLNPNTLLETNLQPSWKNLIVVIHGWNPDGFPNKFTDGEWPQLLSNLDDATKTTDWHVVAYDWSANANTGKIADVSFGWSNATAAAGNATVHGDYLGSLLADIPNLREVQFIAHSAGSWAAKNAAQLLLVKNKYVVVQITLLDPFIPDSADSDLIMKTGMDNNAMSSIPYAFTGGDRIQRLENYYANDSWTHGWNSQVADWFTLGTQDTFNWRGKDKNQEVDWGPIIISPPGFHSVTYTAHYDWHSGPIKFYADTVAAAIPGGAVSPDLPSAGSPFEYQQLAWNLGLCRQSSIRPAFSASPSSNPSIVHTGDTVTIQAPSIRAAAYQWFKNKSPISGANGSFYQLTNASSADSGDYVLEISNTYGVLYSDTLTVNVLPAVPTASSLSSVTPSSFVGPVQKLTITGSNITLATTLLFTDPYGGTYNSQAAKIVVTPPSKIEYTFNSGSYTGVWKVQAVNVGVPLSNQLSFAVTSATSPPPPPPTSGSLTVTLSPSGAVNAGAQWKVDGGSYRNSGDTATLLTPGQHTISFKTIAGYNTPSNNSVSIIAGNVTAGSGTYNVIAPSTYTLTLGTSNPDAGGITPFPFINNIYTAGSTVRLTAYANYGWHFTGFSGDAGGTTNPVDIVMNGNKTVTANYAPGDPRLGTIIVTIQPPEAVTAGVKWGTYYDNYRDSGTSWTTDPGNNVIVVQLVNGWVGTILVPVTVTAGQTTNYTITVSSTGGSTAGSDPRTYSTLAGLAGSFGSTDGTSSTARFYLPWSTAVDGAGNIYVADKQNATIRKISPSGVVTTLAGEAGSEGSADGVGSSARFSNPLGVAVDSNGNVYVGDFGNATIRKITPGGTVSTLAGLAGNTGSAEGTGSAARFYQPAGVAVDSSGNVYVGDYHNHTIRKITPSGTVATLAGQPGSFGTADGVGSAARFRYPDGVAVDSSGNVYVADTANHTIRKITPGGTVSTLAGFPGSGGAADGTGNAARFSSPEGVAVDSIGNVYVADNNNNTIRKVTSAGVVSTLAGLSGNFGSTDGSGNTARFHSPTGVAIDTAGNLFVADAANNTIRTTRQVGKADQLITFGLLPDKSAGDPPFAVTATATSGLPVTLSIISGPATVSSNIVTLTGAGVVTVRASQSGNATFNAALNVDRSFTVATLPQFVTFGTLSQQVVGDAPFSLAATSTSGQAVTYSIISGPAEMTGNIVTITGSGLIVVRASVAGDSSHLPASVDQAFVASPGINLVTDMQVFGNSSFYFRYYGLIGKNYVLQQSSDLVTWEASPFQVNGLGYYEITQPIQGERLFFRVTTP